MKVGDAEPVNVGVRVPVSLLVTVRVGVNVALADTLGVVENDCGLAVRESEARDRVRLIDFVADEVADDDRVGEYDGVMLRVGEGCTCRRLSASLRAAFSGTMLKCS